MFFGRKVLKFLISKSDPGWRFQFPYGPSPSSPLKVTTRGGGHFAITLRAANPRRPVGNNFKGGKGDGAAESIVITMPNHMSVVLMKVAPLLKTTSGRKVANSKF